MSITFPIFICFFLLISFFDPAVLSKLKNYIPFFLGSIMFGMGMTLEISEIKKIFLNPKWILTGLTLQFSVMPLIAFVLAYFFNLSNELFLGLIIVGSCPGGTASNVIAFLAKANIPLSITLTLVSTFLSVIITPFWIFLLSNETININISNLISSTFWIIVFPLLDGLILRNILKNRIKKIIIYFPKLSEFFIALIIGIIFSLNHNLISQISFLLILVIVLHNLIGFLVGYFTSTLFNFPINVRKTIAIEVGMQNSGLGMTLAILHFSKLSALPSAIFSLWHNLAGIFLIFFWSKKNK